MITKTEIAGINLDSYILNASGPKDSTLEELEIIARSGSSGIMMKSSTIEGREGHTEPRYAGLPLGSIQSMGLPNLGYEIHARFAFHLKEYNKPIIASAAGLYLNDYPVMVDAFQNSDVDLIEINLSCPNNLKRKSIFAYDLEGVKNILESVCYLGEKPIGLKLPHYCHWTDSDFKQMADLIISYGVSFITCINSMSGLVIDPEKETPVIKPNEGVGGIGGDYLKPFALLNVRKFYKFLEGKVSIFGAGGVESGEDAFEFLLAGADAVQVATVFEKEGPSCFGRINKELEEILERKGYSSIQEAKGKLECL